MKPLFMVIKSQEPPTLSLRLTAAVDIVTTIKIGVQFRNKQLSKILFLPIFMKHQRTKAGCSFQLFMH